ncbi:MAG: UDP-3-O-(3-hydroxymyristoyl)glucosamine N-acyltransferase [Planctomycetes bacterium]|nr:UDP-3-O-(3-hydroxymyristoyl)glucosamine N-acyltransferase [Planctomycetota bacterium]
MEMTLREVADLVGGELVGDADDRIRGVCALDADEDTAAGCIAFVVASIPATLALMTHVPALLVGRLPHDGVEDKAWVVVKDPYLAYAKVAQVFHPLPVATEPYRDATAIVHPEARIEDPVSIGPQVVLEEGCRIGSGSVLMHGVHIGAGSRIGRNVVLHPRVTIYGGCRIGDRVRVHSGAVLGSDGFGNAKEGERYVRIPQIGGLVIGDDCEIGANTTIDGGTLSPTRIGKGVRIDNLVMVAHNCVVGDHTALAAQVGLAGSTHVGARCMLGGQVGVAGHLRIVDDVVIGAQAGVIGNITEPGLYWGTPARRKTEVLRGQAETARMSEVRRRVAQLERRLTEIVAELDITAENS